MRTHQSASRRRDVYSTHRLGSYFPRRRREATSAAVQARGIDSAGRFVGPRDLDRAFDFFWSQPCRRGSAPIVRAEFEFGPRAHASLNHGGAGRPRSLEKSGLDFEKLRAIFHRYAGGHGETKTALAAEYGVSINTLSFHLRNGGSASMKAALAAHQPAGAAAAA